MSYVDHLRDLGRRDGSACLTLLELATGGNDSPPMIVPGGFGAGGRGRVGVDAEDDGYLPVVDLDALDQGFEDLAPLGPARLG